jgi:hypothetical protein
MLWRRRKGRKGGRTDVGQRPTLLLEPNDRPLRPDPAPPRYRLVDVLHEGRSEEDEGDNPPCDVERITAGEKEGGLASTR